MKTRSTTVSAQFNRAIKVDENLLKRIEGCSSEFFQRARESILSETQYSVKEFPDSSSVKAKMEEADARREYDAARSYRKLYDELRHLDKLQYNVILADATVIDNITLDEILELSNSRAEEVISLSISNKGYGDHHFNIRFLHRHGSCVEFSCQSDLAIGRQLKSCLMQHLESATRPWWYVQKGNFGWPIFIGAMILLNISNVASGIENLTSKSTGIQSNQAWGMVQVAIGGLFLLGLAGAALTAMLSHGWNWLFPKIEYAWGGGLNRTRSKDAARKIVFWTVPVTLIGSAIIGAIAGKIIN